ncbi:hypothetical protein DY000_02033225 [Brassica cretica]|uniref:Uncharacterized protein n=1 Tax=Brassica cretica TaxID=69181 RepID=A0ABQ7DZ37_BRACR|nr:hypothetical protein DY000_02033224 [Brassica cretica]KAF3582787.1 hypothetical protein DY000_02033225 [Brassica cretica]
MVMRQERRPQYEGCFHMPGVHHTLTPSPEEDIYTKDDVMGIIKKGKTDQDKMYDKMHQTMDILFYPLHNSIAWISKTMEELQQKLEYTEWIIQRKQY